MLKDILLIFFLPNDRANMNRVVILNFNQHSVIILFASALNFIIQDVIRTNVTAATKRHCQRETFGDVTSLKIENRSISFDLFPLMSIEWRHGNQHNDNQHNDTQHNDTQYIDT
jgi:hypothetical protein